MTSRPLLLSAVVGIAALGAFQSPAAAQTRGYVSISVGTPGPYYRGDYGRGHRPGYLWVPAHWASTYRGRVWVPGQYVRARGYGHYRDYDRGYGPPVIYRSAPNLRPLPGGFYYQRGGGEYERGYYPPHDNRPYRGW